MKIEKCSNSPIINSSDNKQDRQVTKPYNPSFGSGVTSVLSGVGSFMQGVENGGFLVSFLIQDCLGMTMPRVGAAFLRDKEVTGHYNVQEGFEVLGREGLTGPCMMAVAPIMFALAAKFGKTTSVNSQLIKRFGNSLKEMVAKSDFDRALLKNKDKFKEEFFRKNIRKMLENSLGKENVKEESIEYILKQLKNYENIPVDAKTKKLFGKNKYRKECLANISEHIDNIRYNTSTDLNMLQKIKVGSDELKDIKAFSTKEAIDAMVKYSNDAIAINKQLDKLDAAHAESIKNSSIAKRMIANISTMAATLGVLSILPKIYAKSDIAPGAQTANKLREIKEQERKLERELEHDKEREAILEKDLEIEKKRANGEVSFKGSKNPLSKLGEIISKHSNEKISSELEYNGHNFTHTLMAGLSLFGLLLPRGLRAYNRAQTDDVTGKKDLTELYEILIRDITSSLAVVFVVPMLTRAFVTSYEKQSGFVLMQKNRNMSKSKTLLNLLNPYSQAHVLTNSEISSLYNNVDSLDKMKNFCKYIDKNNGDLQKILSKSETVNTIFNEKTLDLSKLKNLDRSEKNKKIIEFFEHFDKQAVKLNKSGDKTSLNQLVTNLMKSVKKPKGNGITAFARGLNSIPALLTMVFISPYILGWFIPRLTYANTRRIHEKQEREREAILNKTA